MFHSLGIFQDSRIFFVDEEEEQGGYYLMSLGRVIPSASDIQDVGLLAQGMQAILLQS
jgi:hypothetical protein